MIALPVAWLMASARSSFRAARASSPAAGRALSDQQAAVLVVVAEED
jgi:hypothetical protein